MGQDESKALFGKPSGEITATEAMKRLNLKPNTFYRRAKEMGI